MTHDLTHGSVWKVIVRFALPLLIGNLLQQLYNVTDSIIVGQFLGKEALAAVSASFFIYYFIISLVIGVGSGTSVVVSQFSEPSNTTRFNGPSPPSSSLCS